MDVNNEYILCNIYQLQISEGLKYSEMALQREHEHPTYMLSRCHLYVGIGHLMSARYAFDIFAFSLFFHILGDRPLAAYN